jgi:hypothetical protein
MATVKELPSEEKKIETNSLAIFGRGAELLAKANTVQQAHELQDMAITAAVWAKRRKMGQEAVQMALTYALDAERKMGELLATTERTNAARDKKAELHGVTPPPTLDELEISKKQSADAQKLAALPVEVFEEVRSGKVKRAAAFMKKKDGAPPEPEPPLADVVDSVGQAIPEKLRPIFARRGEINALLTQLSALKSSVMKSFEAKDSLYRLLHLTSFKANMENAYSDVKQCLPFASCPYCKAKGCKACGGSGYVNRLQYKSAPREMRKDLPEGDE